MTREERLDWLCRLRGQLIYFNMPDHWRTNFTHALSDEINDLQQQPCEDCISRKAVKAYKYHRTMYPNFEDYVDMLPPVNPQEPKTGHWMKQDLGYKCSNCTLCTNEKGRLTYNYCPNCGVKMLPTDLQFGDQDTLMSAT